MINAIGFLAATLTTLSFAPQLIKTWQTRSADDLSLGMLWAFVLGVFLWLVYGLAIGSTPLVAANAVTLTMAGAQLVMTLRFRGKKRP
jgi:MtN3 and saliva related transmembrane protein